MEKNQDRKRYSGMAWAAGWLFTIGYLKLAFLVRRAGPPNLALRHRVRAGRAASTSAIPFYSKRNGVCYATELSSRRRRYLPRSTNSMSPSNAVTAAATPARHDRNVESPEEKIETSIGAIRRGRRRSREAAALR